MRQSSIVAAAVANFIANTLNTDVLDDGNLTNLTTNSTSAIQAFSAVSAHGTPRCRRVTGAAPNTPHPISLCHGACPTKAARR
jgi:hypothetical protein